NLRALAALGALLVAALPGAVGLKMLQEWRGRVAYLREARARLAKGQPAPALGYLNRYLELNPGDAEAGELKAGVLADAAQTEAQLVEAARLYTQVLGMPGDPDSPARLGARRRLVRLLLREGDLLAAGGVAPDRARAAEAQARELLARLAR